MVDFASDLHDDDPDSKKLTFRENTNIEALTDGDGSARALKHYKLMGDVTETSGGVIWAYERMADGRIFDEEGVWISARLLASNAVQWLVVLGTVVTYVVALSWFDTQKANTVAVGRRRLEEEDLCFCDAGTTESAIDVDDFVQEYDSVWRGRRRNLRSGGIIGVASAGGEHVTEAPTQVPSGFPSASPSHSPTASPTFIPTGTPSAQPSESPT